MHKSTEYATGGLGHAGRSLEYLIYFLADFLRENQQSADLRPVLSVALCSQNLFETVRQKAKKAKGRQGHMKLANMSVSVLEVTLCRLVFAGNQKENNCLSFCLRWVHHFDNPAATEHNAHFAHTTGKPFQRLRHSKAYVKEDFLVLASQKRNHPPFPQPFPET